jgi:hypothetical protein
MTPASIPRPGISALKKVRPVYDDSRTILHLRRLIWLYMILLVIEGALRKWIVPQFSNPLLIVRDPVVLAIYFFALRARVFPRGPFIVSLALIAFLSCAAGILVLEPYLPWQPLALVTAYGFRSNFLHLPLIFVIGKVLDADDVRWVGRWTLLGMIPMAALMAAQFKASPESFINRTVGLGEGQQITAGSDKIRPPGTFSFVSGTIFYVTSSVAFLISGAMSRVDYKNWLLLASGFSVVVAVAVSGSRSLVGSVVLVILSLVAILILRPQAMNRFGRNLLIIVVVGLVMSRLPIFKEGLGVLSERFTSSAEASEMTMTGGIVDRIFGGFTDGFKSFDKLPIGGYGLGIGTNAGARFLVGRAAFLLAEGEWSRVLLESGPILGLAFLLWRSVLTVRLGYLSLATLARGEILPTIIFSAGFGALVTGQFGQPTSLGFAVVLNGLCLAATDKSRGSRPASATKKTGADKPAGLNRVPGQSEYARKLHSSSPADEKLPNGSIDR